MTLYPTISDREAKSVVLLGAGNVASHLLKALRQLKGYRLVYHYVRSLGMKLADVPRSADLYIFALSDTALPEVWQAMPPTTGVWIHLAGSVSMQAMQAFHTDCAVVYPLQTFSKGRSINWAEVPIYYEGHEEAKHFAEALSRHTAYADEVGRRHLHLAAVLACNYSNYLISLAEDYLADKGFDPKCLLPLLRETFSKIEQMPARKAQTGPALRGDRSVIERHLEMLPEGRMRQLYALLAEAIMAERGHQDRQ